MHSHSHQRGWRHRHRRGRLAQQRLARDTSQGRPGGRHSPLKDDSATPCPLPGDLTAAAMIRRPKARCSRPERALPPGPSAPAQLTSPADGPGPASLPTEAVCLDREPPQGPPARAGGARVRVIALLDQSPATPGHLIESERAESRAPAPAREQRVRGRAHLLLWMPQTSRLPSVAIICRAGLNAA